MASEDSYEVNVSAVAQPDGGDSGNNNNHVLPSHVSNFQVPHSLWSDKEAKEVARKADSDGNGFIDRGELEIMMIKYAEVQRQEEEMEEQVKTNRKIIAALIVLMLAMVLAMFGVSMAAAEASKDHRPDDDGQLKKSDGSYILVASADTCKVKTSGGTDITLARSHPACVEQAKGSSGTSRRLHELTEDITTNALLAGPEDYEARRRLQYVDPLLGAPASGPPPDIGAMDFPFGEQMMPPLPDDVMETIKNAEVTWNQEDQLRGPGDVAADAKFLNDFLDQRPDLVKRFIESESNFQNPKTWNDRLQSDQYEEIRGYHEMEAGEFTAAGVEEDAMEERIDGLDSVLMPLETFYGRLSMALPEAGYNEAPEINFGEPQRVWRTQTVFDYDNGKVVQEGGIHQDFGSVMLPNGVFYEVEIFYPFDGAPEFSAGAQYIVDKASGMKWDSTENKMKPLTSGSGRRLQATGGLQGGNKTDREKRAMMSSTLKHKTLSPKARKELKRAKKMTRNLDKLNRVTRERPQPMEEFQEAVHRRMHDKNLKEERLAEIEREAETLFEEAQRYAQRVSETRELHKLLPEDMLEMMRDTPENEREFEERIRFVFTDVDDLMGRAAAAEQLLSEADRPEVREQWTTDIRGMVDRVVEDERRSAVAHRARDEQIRERRRSAKREQARTEAARDPRAQRAYDRREAAEEERIRRFPDLDPRRADPRAPNPRGSRGRPVRTASRGLAAVASEDSATLTNPFKAAALPEK